MSSTDNNGLPPLPQGVEEYEAPKAYEVPCAQATSETSIVPAGTVDTRESIHVWMGLVACALAGGFMPMASMVASLLAGYGTLMLTVTRSVRTAAAAMGVATIAAVVVSFLTGIEMLPAALVSLLTAAAMGIGLGTSKLTSGRACLVCVLAALALLGIDAALALVAGTTLPAAVVAQFDAAFDSVAAGMSGFEGGLETARNIMRVIWPSTYTLSALISVIAAALGTRIARMGLGSQAPRALTLTTFDPPLWVAGALLAAIIGLALSQVLPFGDIVLVVAANLAIAVRFAFGISGIAVATWFIRRRGATVVISLVIAAILVLIDLQFFVMAIVGLIDFWANFRHLPRGEKQVASEA